MIRALVDYALDNRFLILSAAVLLLIWGAVSFHNLPVEDGDDLKTLEATGDHIVNVLRTVPGVADLGLFRVIGQPNLEFVVDRQQSARYGINVAGVQDAIETAVGVRR